MDIFRKRILCLLIASALAGCGGGSDGDNTSSGSGETPPPTDPGGSGGGNTELPTEKVAAIATDIVAGRVTAPDNSAIADADLTLSFFDGNQNLLLTLSADTDSDGYYQVQIPTLEADSHLATKLTISIDKDGYTNNEKVIAIDESSTLVSINATLTPVSVQTVKREDFEAIAVSANGVPSLKFTLVKNSTGQQRLLTDDTQAASGESTQLSLSLPISSIPEDVEAINSEVAYFDSSNAQDLQNFPGEFTGQGETDAQGQGISFNRDDDDSSYRLISSTFSQIKLTNQDQQDLPLSDLQAASDNNPSIIMSVPTGSYKTIQKDFDLSVDGIQIPIYVYKSNVGWQYVGNGLLVNDANGDEPTTENHITIGDDGKIDLTGYNSPLYVKVEITEANNWIKWINLDWPIKAADEVLSVCITGQIDYGNGENYSGQFNTQLPDGGSRWVNVNNGSYEFIASFTDDYDTTTLLDPSNWVMSVLNPKTGKKESLSHTGNLTDGIDNCNVVNHELFNPFQCQLSGYIYESDGETPVSGTTISLSHTFGRGYVLSNDSGYYETTVPCNTDITVNALATDKETTASSSTPARVDFTQANVPPVLSAIRLGGSAIKVDQSVQFRWSTSDADGDDVSVSVACNETDNCTIDIVNSQATASFATAGSKTVVISATDNINPAVTKSFGITVDELDNIAPEILGFNVGGNRYNQDDQLLVLADDEVSIEAIVRDRNGDNINFMWSGCDATTDSNCTFTASQQDKVSLKVEDDHSQNPLSVQSWLNVLVQEDTPPEAELFLSNYRIGSDGSVNLSPIRVLVNASDDFTAQADLIYDWLLTGEDDMNYQDLLPEDNTDSFTIPANTLPVGKYTLTVTVSDAIDGNSTPRSTDFYILENTPPTLSLSADTNSLTVLEGQTANTDVQFTANVMDDDGIDNVSLSWTLTVNGEELTQWLDVAADGLSAKIKSTSLTAGNYLVAVTATDSAGLQSEAQTLLSVTEDKKPVISSLSATPQSQRADEDGVISQDVTLSVNAMDDNGDVTIEWQTTPSLSITPTATAVIPASQLAIGHYQAQVTVTDSQGQSTSQSITFSVLDFEGNVGIIID